VYQGRSQPIVKAKWKVEVGEGVCSSKANKGISVLVSRKEVTSGEVVEEGAIGRSAIA
jgi:hypothetical protein